MQTLQRQTGAADQKRLRDGAPASWQHAACSFHLMLQLRNVGSVGSRAKGDAKATHSISEKLLQVIQLLHTAGILIYKYNPFGDILK